MSGQIAHPAGKTATPSRENSRCKGPEAQLAWHVPATAKRPTWLEWCEERDTGCEIREGKEGGGGQTV